MERVIFNTYLWYLWHRVDACFCPNSPFWLSWRSLGARWISVSPWSIFDHIISFNPVDLLKTISYLDGLHLLRNSWFFSLSDRSISLDNSSINCYSDSWTVDLNWLQHVILFVAVVELNMSPFLYLLSFFRLFWMLGEHSWQNNNTISFLGRWKTMRHTSFLWLFLLFRWTGVKMTVFELIGFVLSSLWEPTFIVKYNLFSSLQLAYSNWLFFYRILL